MLTQATPYTTTVHKHGRYRVIAGDVFIRHGYDYPINTTDRSGVRLDILTPIAEQLDAMLSIYSRVYFTRFDLRLPENTPINTGNTWVSDLFKKLRERLKSKLNRPVGLAETAPQLCLWMGTGERESKTGALPLLDCPSASTGQTPWDTHKWHCRKYC